MAGTPRRGAVGRHPPDGGPSPARGYSWLPFEKGHTLSMTHGAHSARRVEPIALELVAGLLDDRPELARYPETVWAWGRAEARCVLLAAWHAEHGLVDEDGNIPAG